jgi:GTP pyrophosphokinase
MNISTANCRTIGNDKAVNTFEFAIGDLKALRDVMRKIERLEGVMSVERLYSAAATQEAEGG